MILGRTTLAALALGMALSGCGPQAADDQPEAVAANTTAASPASPPAAGATVGGDGSAIVLSTLTMDEVEAAKLEGELACSFAETGASQALLVAMGDVASKSPSQGIVKVASSVERIAAPGGFDGMLETAVFTGAGKTLRLAVTGPAVGNAESPPRPATLTYQRADGASRVFTGEWICGP